MSYTEINDEKAFPYGGMPHDEIVWKLAETDPDLVREVRGDDPFYDLQEAHRDYVRSEILDWSPDETWLESQHPARTGEIARTTLNLRYSGGRGPNDYRLPTHPELFMGFTGNDPRGRDVEQPVIARVRGQQAARARNLEVRMGHNVGHGGPGGFVEAERPWTGMSREYDKKEMQRRLKAAMQWFPAQKVGRPWGRNTIADELYGLRQRERVLGGGDEGLYVPEQDQPGPLGPLYGPRPAPAAFGHAPVVGAEGGGSRRVDRPAGADTAPWRLATPDAAFAAQQQAAATGGGRTGYGPGGVAATLVAGSRADGAFAAQQQAAATGRGRTDHGPGGVAETLVAGGRADGAFGAAAAARAPNRRALAEGMASAAARAAARAAGGDAPAGVSAEAPAPGVSAPQLARNRAAAARLGVPDRLPHPGAVGEGGARQPAGPGGPPADRQRALYAAEGGGLSPPGARLAAAEAMVRGLRAGTPADLRAVQGLAAPAGSRGGELGEPEGRARGARPAQDYGKTMGGGVAALGRPGAAADLEGAPSGPGVPGPLPAAALLAQGGGFVPQGLTPPGRAPPQSKGPEFAGHRVDGGGTLGGGAAEVFGAQGEAWGGGGGAPGSAAARARHRGPPQGGGDGSDAEEGGLSAEGFGGALGARGVSARGWS